MTTALDLIESALRKIHVLGKGSSLDSSEAQDALDTLNAMLSSWSAEGDLVYAETKETFNLSSAASYTIGSGLTFDTTRPLYITAAYTTQGGIDYPLTEIDHQQYAGIQDKDLQEYPELFYYDAGYTTGTIYLDCSPITSTITLYSVKPLSSFSSLSASFSMPPEYEAAIVYNLAVWLAPEYEREASMTVKQIAHDTKSIIETQNNRNEFNKSLVDVPDRGRNEGNIYSGYFN